MIVTEHLNSDSDLAKEEDWRVAYGFGEEEYDG